MIELAYESVTGELVQGREVIEARRTLNSGVSIVAYATRVLGAK